MPIIDYHIHLAKILKVRNTSRIRIGPTEESIEGKMNIIFLGPLATPVESREYTEGLCHH